MHKYIYVYIYINMYAYLYILYTQVGPFEGMPDMSTVDSKSIEELKGSAVDLTRVSSYM